MRIAMVCLGNICRSPMAAVVASSMATGAGLGDQVRIESFGTAGYHRGEPADPRAEAALRRRGWSAGGHRARRLSAEDVRAADLVLCADRDNLAAVHRLAGPDQAAKVRLLRSFDPAARRDAEVPDPWFGDDSDFDAVVTVIEAACRGLVDELAAGGR